MKRVISFSIALLLLSYHGQTQVVQVNQSSSANEAFNKGILYGFSGFVIKDIEKAKIFFIQALQLGNTKAYFELGRLYGQDLETESRNMAINYFEKAAEHGRTDAWTALGHLFYQTSLQHQDFNKAYAFFKKGAELNNNDCVAMLGYFHFKGLNGQQDYEKAFGFFSKAAQNDNPMALYFLGLHYRNGYGVDRNIALARTLLVKSAGQHHFQAIKELEIKEPENPIVPIVPPAILQLAQVNGYKRIKHNMPATSITGEYKGYAIRYDFSEKNILSVFPLEVSFNIAGNKVTGIWKEEGDTTNIIATYTESSLVFSNTSYNKIDHYSEFRGGEIWQFNNAQFNLLQQTDNTYMTGNIQLYSHLRMEPGRPLYVHLSRVTTNDEAKVMDKSIITLAGNSPFTNNIQASFKITQATAVILKLFTAGGVQIFTQNAGVLPSGTYTRNFTIDGSLASGSYVLQIETKTGNRSIILIKQ